MWNSLKNKRRVGEAYKAVFCSPEGEIVLDDLIKTGKILEGVSGETEEGMRRMALYILEMLNWRPDNLKSKISEVT